MGVSFLGGVYGREDDGDGSSTVGRDLGTVEGYLPTALMHEPQAEKKKNLKLTPPTHRASTPPNPPSYTPSASSTKPPPATP
jgi:hypothetical protein